MRHSPGAARARLTRRLASFAAHQSVGTRKLLRAIGENSLLASPFLKARKGVDWSQAETVDHIDAWALLDQLAQELTSTLTDAGVEAVRVVERGEQTIAIPLESRRNALTVLASSPAAANWWLSGASAKLERLTTVRPDAFTKTRVKVHRIQVTRNKVPVAGPEIGVSIQFWRTTTAGEPRRDGGEYRAGTRLAVGRNSLAEYLNPDLWAEAQSDPERILPSCRIPQLLDFNRPIDAVYTWVDDRDPAWRQRRAAAQGVQLDLSADAMDAARTRSRNELLYSLRSLSAYAGWIRHVWVVTDDQVPEWLEESNPKLTVVSHREIFTDPAALPVFNSHAIESQLHHIKGLADHFLYFNDDVFIGRPVRPEAFFHGNGIPRFLPSLVSIDRDHNPDLRNGASLAARNDRALIEQRYGRTITNRIRHIPYPHEKVSLDAFEQAEPGLFAKVARSKFRNAEDFAIASELDHYQAFAQGRASVGDFSALYLDIGSPNLVEHLDSLERLRAWDAFCLNDIGGYSTDIDESAIAEFLQRYFPLPSPFEKRDANA